MPSGGTTGSGSTSTSRCSTTTTIDDLSPLLFSKETSIGSSKSTKTVGPLIGPIAIAVATSSSRADRGIDSTTTDPNITDSVVVHGRGVVATRDIAVGECLFCTLPSASAPLHDVLRVYRQHNSGQKSLESIAETILLKHMKRKSKQAGGASFMYCTTGTDEDTTTAAAAEYNDKALEILIGQYVPEKIWWEQPVADETLRQIIRHNAFGPDFHNYQQMEINLRDTGGGYARVLGMYSLAAMLNHSCQPNAVRAFSGEYMLVHACQPIPKGHEILHSYIPPTQPYHARQAQLKTKFDFICQCKRCTVEGGGGGATNNNANNNSSTGDVPATISFLLDQDAALQLVNQPNLRMARMYLEPHVKELERILSQQSNNLIRHYIRTSYLNLYLNYMNASLLLLLSPSRKNNSNNPTAANTTTTPTKQQDYIKKEMATICMQLHLALHVTHNASTEHLSILHTCYDLNHKNNSNNQMASMTSYWTEQLKRAHMTRYGSMGHQLESIRQTMQHTKSILRQLDGMQKRQYYFL